MNELFLKIINMSISASWLVLAVLICRFVLKKAPKWVNVLLWGIVAVRLICPFSFESALSLIPSAETFPDQVISGPSFDVQTGIAPVDNRINDYLGDRYFEGVTVPTNNGNNVMTILTIVWIIGILLLVTYTIISYQRLNRKIDTAVRYKDNIFQSENVRSPFVLGIIKPRIYLPFNMNEQDLEHVVAHEQAHIRRKDHWWKPRGFLLLTIHWFNPIMWLAYVLLCRDIELACDERRFTMADIKTRDVVKGSIKTIDKAAVAGERMKQAYISTKDRAEHSTYAAENSADEYASDKFERGVDTTVHEGIHQFDKAGRKGLETTKDNIHKAKDGIDRFKEKRAEKALEKQAENVGNKAAKTAEKTTEHTVRQAGSKTVKTVEKSAEKTVKQSVTSAGKKTVKTVGKGAVKTTGKTVKTAERTAKTAIKTSQQAAKTAQKAAQASAKAARAAAQAAKAAAKAAVVAAKWIAKATVAVVKAIIAAVKGLVAAIAAGGWVAVVIIIVICLVALILCSVFGIFFSGEDSGTGQTMQTAVQEINTEYDNKLLEIRNGTTYDVLEMSGSRAVWKDVLAVYAVKTNTDPDNPQEVATMDDNKKQLLKDLFWEMNEVSSRTESVSETVITETDDGNGNIVQTETTVTRTYLYITVAHKTVDEMASQYGFNQEQKDYLTELLKPENNSLWAAALYGINYSDDQIVTVALTQIGNVGGDPYWSWYGFGSRVEWCACFVSWCANECGYIDTGVIPKYAGCVNGVQWFKDRGQWVDGSAEPVAGMIIFFDWDSPDGSSGPQDGLSDHTGIVQKVENGIVYTVEGNSGDSVRVNQYSVGHYEILGYGVPQY